MATDYEDMLELFTGLQPGQLQQERERRYQQHLAAMAASWRDYITQKFIEPSKRQDVITGQEVFHVAYGEKFSQQFDERGELAVSNLDVALRTRSKEIPHPLLQGYVTWAALMAGCNFEAPNRILIDQGTASIEWSVSLASDPENPRGSLLVRINELVGVLYIKASWGRQDAAFSGDDLIKEVGFYTALVTDWMKKCS